MNRFVKLLVVLVALISVTTAGVLLSYDWLYENLPTAIALRLPDLSGPAPEALPLPNRAVATSALEIPGVVAAANTPLPTVTASATMTPVPQPTATATTELVATATDAPPTETPPPTATPLPPTPTATPLPVSFRLQGLTNIPQEFNNCGPANLAIVLTHHGAVTSQTQTASYLKPNRNDRNVSPWQINDYVNEQTVLKSIARSGGDIELMKRFITANLPPVVERGIDYNDGEGWYGHYLTLFGFNDETGVFNAMNTYAIPWAPDGETFSYDEVLSSWKDFNYTFYIVYPPEREAEVYEILGEQLVDDLAMWQNAAEVAREQIALDATDKFAWFNLGTSLTEIASITGDQNSYQEAVDAYDTARTLLLPDRMLWYQFRPYLAYFKVGRFQDIVDLANATLDGRRGGQYVEETFYWKGNALAALGDGFGAAEAYRDALSVNENFYYAQWALDYLTGESDEDNG